MVCITICTKHCCAVCIEREGGTDRQISSVSHGVDTGSMCLQVCSAYGSSLPLDAQLCRLPQLPLLCVVHNLLVAWIRLLGKLVCYPDAGSFTFEPLSAPPPPSLPQSVSSAYPTISLRFAFRTSLLCTCSHTLSCPEAASIKCS